VAHQGGTWEGKDGHGNLRLLQPSLVLCLPELGSGLVFHRVRSLQFDHMLCYRHVDSCCVHCKSLEGKGMGGQGS
jgi:hypothetical protein